MILKAIYRTPLLYQIFDICATVCTHFFTINLFMHNSQAIVAKINRKDDDLKVLRSSSIAQAFSIAKSTSRSCCLRSNKTCTAASPIFRGNKSTLSISGINIPNSRELLKQIVGKVR